MNRLLDYADTSDSDVPISSARRSRSTRLRADLRDGHSLSQVYTYSSAINTDNGNKHNEAEGDSGGDGEDDGEDNSDDDSEDDRNKEDVWFAFSKSLQEFETDDNSRRLYPPSLHADWLPSTLPCDEYKILEQMIFADVEESTTILPRNIHDQDANLPDYQEFILRGFVVYVSVEEKHLPGHMRSLDVVATEHKKIDYYVDGHLEQEGTRRYLHRMLVRDVNIGCLQDHHRHSTKDQIYIRSENGYRVGNKLDQDTWYKLEEPAAEYSNLFASFLWVADLMKHFLDYLTFNTDRDEKVHLEDFEEKFFNQLCIWHSKDPTFQGWHKNRGSGSKFGQYVARHADFLYDQTFSLGKKLRVDLLRQPIWRQICPGNRFFSSNEGPRNKNQQTVVTENVMKAFCAIFPAWGKDGFDLLKVVGPATRVENARQERMQKLRFPDKFHAAGRYHNRENIALTASTLEKVGSARSILQINAQDIVGKVVIVRWTRWDRSDKAYAGFGYSYALARKTVPHRHQPSLAVIWLLNPRETICGESFYPHGNELFFSNECNCQPIFLSNIMAVYGISIFSDHAKAGATFFARETYSIGEECFRTASPSSLQCSCRVDGLPEQGQNDVSVPEVLWSKLSETFAAPERHAPAGAADSEDMKPSVPDQAIQPPLRTLSLFSGCGLFDRGLEDSSVIIIKYAVDCNEYGVQTSLANQKEKCIHRTCSVNYLLERILRGFEKCPEFDCVVSGSPCDGFTSLNNNKAGENAQRNCSLLASSLSYVELFLPHYVLIENVPGMDFGSPNACEQAISCLVGLGYQVRKSFLKACQFEAPQSRRRLFILAASSGLPFPRDPLELATCKPFQTVSDAIGGLPKLDNDTAINITKPDHIPLKRLQPQFGLVNLRTLVQKIPKSPPGMNLYKTYQLGLLDRTEVQWFLSRGEKKRSEKSRSLARIDPNKPFPTLLTSINEMCALSGAVLHPFEDRVMSLEEYKIAQGFLRDDIIIGPLNKQLEQVGNAVARPVAVALGLVIAESWCTGHRQGLIPRNSHSVGQIYKYHGEDQDGDNVDSITDKASILAMDEHDDKPRDTPPITDEVGQLRMELQAADSSTGPQVSTTRQSLSKRRKRMRTIRDSDDEDGLEEQFAVTTATIHRHTNTRRARKSARATRGILTGFSNTAEDPILLRD